MTGEEPPCRLLYIRPVTNDHPEKGRCKAVAVHTCGKVIPGWGNIYRTARLSALRQAILHHHGYSR